MSGQQYSITDWLRILKGATPWQFLIEIGIRVTFLYVLIIVSMRLMGKRMGAQLTRNEMAALVSLAATVGIPMETPDQGLLPALVAACVLSCMQRTIARQAFRSKRFEQIAMDDVDILVSEGTLRMKALRRNAMSRELVVARLRAEGVDQLGAVQRLYLESNGAFTVRTFEEPRPGLTLFPRFDAAMRSRQRRVSGMSACGQCGAVIGAPHDADKRCPECGSQAWTDAVLSPSQRTSSAEGEEGPERT